MQITRLHLLILLFGLFCAGMSVYFWSRYKGSAPATAASTPSSSVTPSSTPRAISSTPILPPVPAARSIRSPALAPMTLTYEVTKGDTLWGIAQNHSPVHQGPGWVAIWKVNKKIVKDFDRIEVGTSLKIPSNPQDYAMRYWKPRLLYQKNYAYHEYSVDLAQLPRPAEAAPGRNGWPPAMPEELQIALRQGEPLPRDLEVALLKSTPLPESLAVALAHASEPTTTVVMVQSMPEDENSKGDVELDAETLASVRLIPSAFGMRLQFQ